MGSSDTQCANGDGYYRLKSLDTGNTTIFRPDAIDLLALRFLLHQCNVW